MANQITHEQAFVRLKSNTGDWVVDPDLRPRLVEDALAQETNLTEIALQILATRYRVPVEAHGRRTEPRPDDEVLNLRVPGKLAKAIKIAAGRSGRKSWIDEIRFALHEHYDLIPPAPRRAAVA